MSDEEPLLGFDVQAQRVVCDDCIKRCDVTCETCSDTERAELAARRSVRIARGVPLPGDRMAHHGD